MEGTKKRTTAEAFIASADRVAEALKQIEKTSADALKIHQKSIENLERASTAFIAAVHKAEDDRLVAIVEGATVTSRDIQPMKTIRFKNNRSL